MNFIFFLYFQADVDFGDDVSLKLLKEFAKKKKRVNFKAETGVEEAEAELERLCKVKHKVENCNKFYWDFQIENLIKQMHRPSMNILLYMFLWQS